MKSYLQVQQRGSHKAMQQARSLHTCSLSVLVAIAELQSEEKMIESGPTVPPWYHLSGPELLCENYQCVQQIVAVAALMDTAVLGFLKYLLEGSLHIIAEGHIFKALHRHLVTILLLTLMGVMQLNLFISLGTFTPMSPI